MSDESNPDLESSPVGKVVEFAGRVFEKLEKGIKDLVVEKDNLLLQCGAKDQVLHELLDQCPEWAEQPVGFKEPRAEDLRKIILQGLAKDLSDKVVLKEVHERKLREASISPASSEPLIVERYVIDPDGHMHVEPPIPASTETETPRTDAERQVNLAYVLNPKTGFSWVEAFDRMTNLARTLERETATLRARIEQLERTLESTRNARDAAIRTSEKLEGERDDAEFRKNVRKALSYLRTSQEQVRALKDDKDVLTGKLLHSREQVNGTIVALRASQAREAELRKALAGLLAAYDEETGTIDARPNPTCPECTSGAVLNSLNKGLCAFHSARAASTKTP